MPLPISLWTIIAADDHIAARAGGLARPTNTVPSAVVHGRHPVEYEPVSRNLGKPV